MSEEYNLDRAQAEQASMDALGKRWVIHANRQNGLCYARPEPDRSDAVIPEHMQGLWTKPSLLKQEIDKHVKKTWDVAEEVKLKNERKAQAAKEAAARAKEAEKSAKEDSDAPVAEASGTDNKASKKENVTKKKVTKK